MSLDFFTLPALDLEDLMDGGGRLLLLEAGLSLLLVVVGFISCLTLFSDVMLVLADVTTD